MGIPTKSVAGDLTRRGTVSPILVGGGLGGPLRNLPHRTTGQTAREMMFGSTRERRDLPIRTHRIPRPSTDFARAILPLGGGRAERAVRRATTAGRGAKPPSGASRGRP